MLPVVVVKHVRVPRCVAHVRPARLVDHPERFERLTLPPEAAWPSPERPLLEHKLGGRIYRPVVALPGSAQTFRQLDEALVKREVAQKAEAINNPLLAS